MLKVNTEK
uniref:Uncharacterized protein n=1 Tax=Arundo donax TaxID=35708 RepID=A0A0A9DRI8_ARUDO